jgi:hypothetical protein
MGQFRGVNESICVSPNYEEKVRIDSDQWKSTDYLLFTHLL